MTTTQRTSFIRSLGALFLATLLLIAGCDSQNVNLPEPKLPSLSTDGDISPHVIPILWDSFGVALKAKVSGTVETDPNGRCPDGSETVLLPGTGQATHMGRITVVQSHCVDPLSSEVTDGEFTYTGTTGAKVTGTYGGLLEPAGRGIYILSIDVKITGGSMPFTDEEVTGLSTRENTIQGKIHSDGSFTYKLDGWLFHHRRKRKAPKK